MIRNTIYFILIFLGLTLESLAQSPDSYISPMDIPLSLSGNFGEMRRNHFHTGIDIKTQGKQGIPLRSIADGHISRIKVSPYGYGNALYIDHPDGNTSVYGHMRSFNDTIASYIKSKQYEAEAWAIEYYPDSNELMVSQGDIIGLSGNSGSSSGPHLHFEIRDTESEHPLNPLNFGIEVEDRLNPLIKGMRVYPLDDFSHVTQGDVAQNFVAKKLKTTVYQIESPVKVNGSIGLGLHTYDQMTNTSNKYGVYKLEMYVQDVLHYSHTMDELDFDNFRQVNCHKDYDLYHANRWRYHKCFPAENNTLSIYDSLVDQGRIWVSENDTIEVKFIASDINGNSSSLSAILIGTTPREEPWPRRNGFLLSADQDNLYLDTGLVVRIPQGRIYDDLYLRPTRKTTPENISDEFCLHDADVPIDDMIFVSIKVRESNESIEGVVMEHTDYKGRKKCLATVARDGWFEAENKSLGTYRLIQDNESPYVKVSGLNSKAQKDAITLSLGDEASGVDNFRVTVDGSWLLMSHNASMSKAWGKLSDLDLSKGEHIMEIIISDLAGNQKVEKITFQY